METIGQKISPILEEIEHTLWEYELFNGDKPEYTFEGLRAATKIFASAVMDKMYEMQDKDATPMKQREEMAQKCGEDIKNLIKTYCNINTKDFY